jgi:hypothetical protein
LWLIWGWFKRVDYLLQKLVNINDSQRADGFSKDPQGLNVESFLKVVSREKCK